MTPFLDELTTAEEEIALLWGKDGLTPAQISARLGITERQVRRAGERARRKLDKPSIAAVAVAVALARAGVA